MDYVGAVTLVAAIIERAQADLKPLPKSYGIPSYCEVEPKHHAKACASKLLRRVSTDLNGISNPTASDVMQAVMENLDG